jgi:hypothetical protein
VHNVSLSWLFVSLPLVVALLIGLVLAFADCATVAQEVEHD